MAIKLTNLVGTRKDPRRRRRIKLTNRAVRIAHKLIPPGKSVLVDKETFDLYRDQILSFIDMGVLSATGSTAEELADFLSHISAAPPAPPEPKPAPEPELKPEPKAAQPEPEVKEEAEPEPKPEPVLMEAPEEEAPKAVVQPAKAEPKKEEPKAPSAKKAEPAPKKESKKAAPKPSAKKPVASAFKGRKSKRRANKED